eukprot:TRINITY_DN3534_c0_g1_i1.p1 TRINITY_DN3534_c0_g1~~TRINITY_DN3534_c0_g1_i1.p1  ORF type:complete len:685 (-),score=69.83 TRINITY_DN3534_c0_g1_i1:566-2620(-)
MSSSQTDDSAGCDEPPSRGSSTSSMSRRGRLTLVRTVSDPDGGGRGMVTSAWVEEVYNQQGHLHRYLLLLVFVISVVLQLHLQGQVVIRSFASAKALIAGEGHFEDLGFLATHLDIMSRGLVLDGVLRLGISLLELGMIVRYSCILLLGIWKSYRWRTGKQKDWEELYVRYQRGRQVSGASLLKIVPRLKEEPVKILKEARRLMEIRKQQHSSSKWRKMDPWVLALIGLARWSVIVVICLCVIGIKAVTLVDLFRPSLPLACGQFSGLCQYFEMREDRATCHDALCRRDTAVVDDIRQQLNGSFGDSDGAKCRGSELMVWRQMQLEKHRAWFFQEIERSDDYCVYASLHSFNPRQFMTEGDDWHFRVLAVFGILNQIASMANLRQERLERLERFLFHQGRRQTQQQRQQQQQSPASAEQAAEADATLSCRDLVLSQIGRLKTAADLEMDKGRTTFYAEVTKVAFKTLGRWRVILLLLTFDDMDLQNLVNAFEDPNTAGAPSLSDRVRRFTSPGLLEQSDFNTIPAASAARRNSANSRPKRLSALVAEFELAQLRKQQSHADSDGDSGSTSSSSSGSEESIGTPAQGLEEEELRMDDIVVVPAGEPMAAPSALGGRRRRSSVGLRVSFGGEQIQQLQSLGRTTPSVVRDPIAAHDSSGASSSLHAAAEQERRFEVLSESDSDLQP